MGRSYKVRTCVTLALMLLLVFSAYAPGLRGPFVFDDQNTILRNVHLAIDNISLSSLKGAILAGGNFSHVNRSIPRLTFALNYFAAGEHDELHYKLTNVVIHLVNGLLVYLLASLLLGAMWRDRCEDLSRSLYRWFPTALALVWALHPIQLTSVLYVVQRITSLAALFVFLGAVLFVWGRCRLRDSRPGGFTAMLAGVIGGTSLGFTCKENAVLLPFFCVLIEAFFFSRTELPAAARKRLALLYGAGFATCLVVVGIYAISSSDLLTRMYQYRNFTPVERLLTESRVLFMYLGLIFFPNLRSFGLYHDDISISTGLFSPWTTGLGVAALFGLIAWSLSRVKRKSVLAFGILWFFLGHGVESGIIGLEIAHEHRNYVPSFGVLFAFVYWLFRLCDRKQEFHRAGVLIIVLVCATLGFVTHARSKVWESRESFTYFTARNHPNSLRSSMEVGIQNELKAVDVRVTFETYRRAALAGPEHLYPIVKLQRILNGLQNDLAEGKIDEEPNVLPQRVDWRHSDLVIHRDSVDELVEQIERELSERLRNFAVDAETMAGLRELVRCTIMQMAWCAPPDRLVEWLEIALDKPRLVGAQRPLLRLLLAKIHAFQGDVDRAIEHMNEAIAEVGPSGSVFVVELAALSTVLRDPDEAERLLDELEASTPLMAARQKEVEILRKRIEKLREEAKGDLSAAR